MANDLPAVNPFHRAICVMPRRAFYDVNQGNNDRRGAGDTAA